MSADAELVQRMGSLGAAQEAPLGPAGCAAHALVGQGFSVFPVYEMRADGTCACGGASGCTPGKHPRTPRGFLDASSAPRQVFAWWSVWPHANIGIATGKTSGIIVIDLDVKTDKTTGESINGIATFQALIDANGGVPNTLTARTGGGGLHLFFRHPGAATTIKGNTGGRGRNLGPGIDVRADGGYVVVPPSNHVSGAVYSWVDTSAIVDPPEWLLSSLIKLSEKGGGGTTTRASAGTRKKFKTGGRNDALTSTAGSMRRQGLSAGAIEAALLIENAETCDPPLNDDEVRKIANSVARYEPAPNPALDAAAETDGDPWQNRLTVSKLTELPAATFSNVDLTLLTFHPENRSKGIDTAIAS